jgi:hypothetical protein
MPHKLILAAALIVPAALGSIAVASTATAATHQAGVKWEITAPAGRTWA